MAVQFSRMCLWGDRALTGRIEKKGDLLQDMYLKELRAYKPTPLKASDSEGHVQRFTAPKAPHSPEEGNIANELKAYEDQQVEMEGQADSGEAGASESSWFEEEEEEDTVAAH
ncbi:MAG: hypothetical protein Q9222_000040 [Ikaeria aurantiellina]